MQGMEEVKFGADWNYSYMESISKALVSFPFPRRDLNCPKEAKVEFYFQDGSKEYLNDCLAIWREVPIYLGRGHGGHLVVFFDDEKNKSQKFLGIEKAQVYLLGRELLDHELCGMPYNIS